VSEDRQPYHSRQNSRSVRTPPRSFFHALELVAATVYTAGTVAFSWK
jgi:hypothetical protein